MQGGALCPHQIKAGKFLGEAAFHMVWWHLEEDKCPMIGNVA